MKKLIIFLLLSTLVFAQSNLIYKEEFKDPVHEKIKAIRNKNLNEEQHKTNDIVTSQPNNENRVLLASSDGIEIPVSIDDFDPVFHFPPRDQGLSSTCWAHAGISFIESEVQRKQGEEIELSVMQIVYYDYLDKCRHYVQTRGASSVRSGSEINGVFKVAEAYGLVPESEFPGISTEAGFDYYPLQDELASYLYYIKVNGYWNEKTIMTTVEAILEKHMGVMPTEFRFKGKLYTPKEFYRKIIKFNPKKYTALQSITSLPFNEYTEFPYPDNWWNSKDYYNLPLDNFYNSIVNTIKQGISVPIGGDTDEPGYNRYAGIAFIPEADIPTENISQDAREFRINNGTTGDDHALHIVGYLNLNGVDWFLIKDSWRDAWQSDHPGYYYYRGDYVKLKMLNAVVPSIFVEK